MTSSDLVAAHALVARARQPWTVRLAEPEDYEAVGDLLCDAYVSAGLEASDGDYLPLLRDVAGRVADPLARVVVAAAGDPADGDTVIGCLTLCGYGSDLTGVCRPGEFEFRMLGVDPSWRRAGVAASLIDACDDLAVDLGLATSIGCAWEGNAAAIKLYSGLGFERIPQRDHHYSPSEFLYVFGRQARFCGQCGLSVRTSDHLRCEAAALLEPPRYCHVCRRRMRVQVMPQGWTARCSRHRDVSGQST